MIKLKGKREGYHSITPYFVVTDAAKFLDFVEKALGGQVTAKHTRDDGSIQHAEARVGDSMLMVGQSNEQWKARPANIYLYVDDVDAVWRQAVAIGGKPLNEPADQPYGDRNGGVEDPCGNIWWIGSEIESA